MIRGVLQNAAVIILFVMPMITMRTYSEEKRSGHDRAAADLAGHRRRRSSSASSSARWGSTPRCSRSRCSTSAILFVFGNPEWRPIVAGYLGLLLMGGCFISVGLLISSLTKNQIVAGVADLRGVPDALGHQLVRRARRARRRGPIARTTCRSPSTSTTSPRASSTPSTCVYYLSFITFGLFLTAKSVDSERWRG